MSSTLRHLLDFELEANGFTLGEIREVRRYLDKGTKDARQRRLCQRYQALRREIVKAEALEAEKEAKRAEMVAYTVFQLAELDTIADPVVRERCIKLAALWPMVEPTVPFPGVVCAEDRMAKDHRQNWYLCGDALPGHLPAMITINGRLTQERAKVGHPVGPLGYRYSTVTVRTALARALRGKDLFNYAA